MVTDYAVREYGLTEADMENIEKKLRSQIQRDRKKGVLYTFTGDIEALVAGGKLIHHPRKADGVLRRNRRGD